MIYSLLGFYLNWRAYNVFAEGHPRRWEVTLRKKGNLIAKPDSADIVKLKLFFTLFNVLAQDSHHIKCSRSHNVRNCIIYVVSMHFSGTNTVDR